MDLSFTLDAGKLEFGQVKVEDVPRIVDMLRQSFREPTLFQADGLREIQFLSTDEVYERFLAVAQHIRVEPIKEAYDMTQTNRIEQAYIYRAEIYRRTHERSTFVHAYEDYVDAAKKARSIRIELYNKMLHELGEEYPLVFETYEEQKRTKSMMLEIIRRPQVLKEINQVVRTILGKVDRSQFKFHLSAIQYHLIMAGSIEDEPLDVLEDLLLTLQRMRKTL